MPEKKVKKSKYVFLFLRVAVVVCVVIWGIFWLNREVGWSRLAEIYHQMNLWIFAVALGIFVLGQVLVGFRWWLLLRTQSIFIPFWTAVRLHFLGLFYNNFMPGSVGGDLIRAWYVTRHTDKRFEAVLSVFVDRVIGLASTLIIATFFYLLFIRGQGKAIAFESQIGFLKRALFWAIIVIAVLFCVLLLHKRGRSVLAKGWAYIRVLAIRMIIKFKDAIVIYCSKPLTILVVFGLTVFLQIMVITAFWFLGVNLGVDISIKYYYVFFTLAWVLGVLPVSIGGAGVVELLLVSLFIVVGIERGEAFALAMCQRIIWMITSLPGAAIHLTGTHLPKDFSIDYNKPIT